MLFPSYVWITYEWNDVNWWRGQEYDAPSNGSTCNNTEVGMMLEGMLVVSHYQAIDEREDSSINVRAIPLHTVSSGYIPPKCSNHSKPLSS